MPWWLLPLYLVLLDENRTVRPYFLFFFDFYSVLYTHYEGLNRPNYYNVASYHIFFIAYKQADL
nr:MAG TPA: hypothetical protein [Caudoviricetes sp.]